MNRRLKIAWSAKEPHLQGQLSQLDPSMTPALGLQTVDAPDGTALRLVDALKADARAKLLAECCDAQNYPGDSWEGPIHVRAH